MEWFWVILVLLLVGSAASLLGSFIVLKGFGMLGDAISHAVLPAIVIGYLIGGIYDNNWFLILSIALAVLTSLTIEWLYQRTRMYPDGIMGLIFTFLFALGLLMIDLWTYSVDLDPECVLFGEAAYIPFSFFLIGNALIPKQLILSVIIWLIILIFTFAGYRPLALSTFDRIYAHSIKMHPSLWQYSISALVAVLTVIAIESVGIVLLLSILVVPASIAFLWAKRLHSMIFLAQIVNATLIFLGLLFALYVDIPISAGIAILGGLALLTITILKKK
ncbi:MAG: metal ABC transporter permease [Chlorobi bacterium]|nr:metal ABC transporter permease [Chlorobiota bacterium]